MWLGGVGGAGIGTSEITPYFFSLFSPYLNVQNRPRVTSSGSFHDAKYLLNDFFCVFSSIFIHLNFYWKNNGMYANGDREIDR